MEAPPARPIPDLERPEPIRIPDAAGKHCENRHSDWAMAKSTVLFGLWIVVWPGSLQQSHFQPVLEFLWAPVIAGLCLAFGGARWIALRKNGDWPIWGPIIRAVGAVFGGILLLTIAFALARQSWYVDRDPSPGIPFYLMFAWYEFKAARRAAADARPRLR